MMGCYEKHTKRKQVLEKFSSKSLDRHFKWFSEKLNVGYPKVFVVDFKSSF